MLQNLIFLMLLILTFYFSQMKHPLSMGFLLLIQTLMICLIIGIMNESFWFSYILFLIFLGGMLILFIYIASLASNEMFNFSLKLMKMMVFSLFISILIIFFIDNMKFIFINNMEMMNYMYNMILQDNLNSINKLYNFPTNLMTLLLINYLFFTLIVVTKITNFFYGPLRNMN